MSSSMMRMNEINVEEYWWYILVLSSSSKGQKKEKKKPIINLLLRYIHTLRTTPMYTLTLFSVEHRHNINTRITLMDRGRKTEW